VDADAVGAGIVDGYVGTPASTPSSSSQQQLRPTAPLVQNAGVVATQLIREAIIDGRFPPGTRLKEEQIARDLGISRTPVREALMVLQAEGLVDTAPNRGAIVRPRSASELDEVYQMRALLEGHAASRACTRISPEAIRALWESCERFERLCEGGTANSRDLVEENMIFHNTILEASDSRVLVSTLKRITDLPLIYVLYAWYSPEQRRVALHYHRKIAKTIEARDAERAALLMKEHLLETRDHVLANIQQEGGRTYSVDG
jgi:DNA-binding GntR family transcriptional regulator